MRDQYASFDDFYPDYLAEHGNRTNRRLHFCGTSLALILIVAAVVTSQWWLILVAFVQGYAWSWVGHFFFEQNKPASFRYPWKSYLGDCKMWWQTLTGKIPF